MIGIIFNTEKEAKDSDWQHNKLTGSVSRYHFPRKLLKATTTLTKAEYAELYNIPSSTHDEQGNSIPNPRYEELDTSYTLNKCAAVVGDYLAVRDEEGEIIKHACPYCGQEFDVVEITEDDLLTTSELL